MALASDEATAPRDGTVLLELLESYFPMSASKKNEPPMPKKSYDAAIEANAAAKAQETLKAQERLLLANQTAPIAATALAPVFEKVLEEVEVLKPKLPIHLHMGQPSLKRHELQARLIENALEHYRSVDWLTTIKLRRIGARHGRIHLSVPFQTISEQTKGIGLPYALCFEFAVDQGGRHEKHSFDILQTHDFVLGRKRYSADEVAEFILSYVRNSDFWAGSD